MGEGGRGEEEGEWEGGRGERREGGKGGRQGWKERTEEVGGKKGEERGHGREGGREGGSKAMARSHQLYIFERASIPTLQTMPRTRVTSPKAVASWHTTVKLALDITVCFLVYFGRVPHSRLAPYAVKLNPHV